MSQYSPSPTALRIEKAFAQVYFFIILIAFTWTSINSIRFPFGMDYGEAPLMDQARRIAAGVEIYKPDLNSPPYVIANYPPLYPLSVATLHSVFNIPLFQSGRLLSFFFCLLSVTIIGLFVYHLTNQKFLGLITMAVFLGNPYVMIWSSQARVDMMALAFSLLGLYIVFRRRDSISWIIIAAACFIIASFTRQTYLLAGPAAAFVWLYSLNRRRSLLFLLIIGLSTLLIFGMINALTHNGFYTNIVTANINRYDFSRTIMMVKQLFTLWPIILSTTVIALVLLICEWSKSKSGFTVDAYPNPFMIFGLGIFSIGAIISALTVGKVGSDVNYFLELIAASAIWMAIALNRISSFRKAKYWIVLSLFFLQLVWVLVGAIPLVRTVVTDRWENLPFYNELYQRIGSSTPQGIVLSDDYLDMVVLSGQEIYYQPFEYGQLFQAGLWDPANFVQEINESKFSLIVIGGNTIDKECCWPDPVVKEIEQNYQAKLVSDVILLTPKY